jgi:hypothetical protein
VIGPRLLGLAFGLVLFAALPCRGQDEQPDLREEVESLREDVRRLTEKLEDKPAAEAATDGDKEGDVADVNTSGVVVKKGPGEPDAEGGGGLLLGLPGSTALRIDGQIRWRGEYRGDGYAQPAADTETDFVVQRIRLSFDLDVTKNLGAKVTIQDSRRWGDRVDGLAGPRLTADTPELHVREGYAVFRDLLDVPVKLKVGRMAVPKLGDQRMMSDLDWSNVGRAWDGVQVEFEPEGWYMTAFASNIREASALAVPGDENDDVYFAGGYVSNRMITDHEFDAFVYFRRIGDNGLAITRDSTGDRGARKDYTVGLRAKGKMGPAFYSGFIAYQLGDQAGDPISAWAAAATVGGVIKLNDTQKFKISSEFSFASGDPDPNDDRIETFDPLFPFAHAYNGHQDLFAWKNLLTTNVRFAFWPTKNLSLHTDVHWFFLQHRKDRWYGLGFSRQDAANTANSNHVGTEVDTYVKLKVLDGHLSIWAGYSHFFPDAYVRNTGSKTNHQDWLFLMATVNF